jgi:hypothetical protein
VLVAIALIESGLDAVDAVNFIRERRYVYTFLIILSLCVIFSFFF